MKDTKIGVVGGDLRQLYAAEELAQQGFECAAFGFDNCKKEIRLATRTIRLEDAIRFSEAIILPLPYSTDNIHLNTPLSKNEIHLGDLFSLFTPGQIIAGGKFDDTAASLAKERGVTLADYYDREDLAVLNAVPTAEGAVSIAMNASPSTVSGSRVLVVGFGRIGKILSHKLAGLGADVSVSARSLSDFAWIEAYGYTKISYDEFDAALPAFDIIFNTVPAIMLDAARLDLLKPDAVVIDLASRPGGVDSDAAKAKNREVISALSLPGKYAPQTAGRTLSRAVEIILTSAKENVQS
ncbi:dipicolinate synthase subunit A [Clostridia bacterium]|nr:dipicolinate synthase subunit A [Clostridia bacterium]